MTPSNPKRTERIVMGLAVANLVGGALIGLAYALTAFFSREKRYFAMTSLLLMPFAMGLAAAWVWKPLDLRIRQTIVHSLTCTLLATGIAAIVFREGLICLIIL